MAGSAGSGEHAGWSDRSQAPRDVFRRSLLLLPLVTAVTLVPFCLRWGPATLAQSETLLLNPLAVLLLLLVVVPLHESLHALGYLLAGVSPRDLELGTDLASGSVLIHCKVPVPADHYRFALVLPLLVIGLGPTILSWGTGIGWLAVAAAGSMAAATGDMLLLWDVRGIAASRDVLDHPNRVGCRVRMSDAADDVHPADRRLPRR